MSALYGFFTETVGSVLWRWIFLPLVVIAGIFFAVRTRGVPLLRAGSVLHGLAGRRKTDQNTGGVTPFQALCTALAGTVGTGSVAGT